MSFDLKAIIRPNIWALHPYRCARDDYSEGILLDANENAFGPALSSLDGVAGAAHLERYPDPHQLELKTLVAAFRGLPSPEHLFLGVGSDECIDLLIRVACVPGRDKILVCPPTYGMYTVSAHVNDVGVVKAPLDVEGGRFSLQIDLIKATIRADPTIKIIFLCSPGNPTGTFLSKESVREVLEFEEFKGLVVVDEAYIDFCPDGYSMAADVLRYPNLVVSQTLSKSFGLAGIRLGISISSPGLAAILNKTKAPYNISTLTSLTAIEALRPDGLRKMRENFQSVVQERNRMIASVSDIPGVARILGGNDANFILAQLTNKDGKPDNTVAFSVYKALAESDKVVVRYRGTELGCEGCLRITIGTSDENTIVLQKLAEQLNSVLS